MGQIKIVRGQIKSQAGSDIKFNPGSVANISPLSGLAEIVNKFAIAKKQRDDQVEKERVTMKVGDETAKANRRMYEAFYEIASNPANAELSPDEIKRMKNKIVQQEDAYAKSLLKNDPAVGQRYQSNYQTVMVNNLQKFDSMKSKFHKVRVGNYIDSSSKSAKDSFSTKSTYTGLYADFVQKLNGSSTLELLAISNQYPFNKQDYEQGLGTAYLNNFIKFVADKKGNAIPLRDDQALNYQAIYNRINKIPYGSEEYKKLIDPNTNITRKTWNEFVEDINEFNTTQRQNDQRNADDINLKGQIKFDKLFSPENQAALNNLKIKDILEYPWQNAEGLTTRDNIIKKVREYRKGILKLDFTDIDLLNELDKIIFAKDSKVDSYDAPTITIRDKNAQIRTIPGVNNNQPLENVSLRDLLGKGLDKTSFDEYGEYFSSDANLKSITALHRTELSNIINEIEFNIYPEIGRVLNPEGNLEWIKTQQELRQRYKELRKKGISHDEAIKLDFRSADSIFHNIDQRFKDPIGNISKSTATTEKPSTEVQKLYNDPSLKNQKDFYDTYGEDAFNRAINENRNVFDEVYNPRLKGFQSFNIQPTQNIVEQVAQVAETEGGLFEIPQLLGVEPPPENASEQEKMDYVLDLGMQYVGSLGPVKRIDKLIGPLTKIFNKAVGKSVKNPTAKKHALAYEIFRRKGKDIGAEVDDFEDLTPFIKNPNKTMNEFQVKDFIEFVDEGAEVVVKTDNANKLVVTITKMIENPRSYSSPRKLKPKKTQITNPTLQKLIDKGYKLKESDIGIDVE